MALDFTNHIVVQNWGKEVSLATMDKVPLADLIGGRSAVVYRPRELTGKAGDSTTIQLRDRYRRENVKRGNVDTRLTGSPSVNMYPEKVALYEAYTAYDEGANGQSLNAQKVAVNMADEAKEQVSDDLADLFSRDYFAQLSGVAIEGADGGNELVAPTNIVNVDNILEGIVDGVATAKKALINPVQGLQTGAKFVLYMSYDEEAALRKFASKEKLTWFDLAATVSIAQRDPKLLTKDLLGVAYGVELRSSQYCPTGTMFLQGAQSMVAQFGQGFGEDDLVHTNTEIFDGTIFHAKGWSVYGLKKTQFRGKDFGTVALKLKTTAAAK